AEREAALAHGVARRVTRALAGHLLLEPTLLFEQPLEVVDRRFEERPLDARLPEVLLGFAPALARERPEGVRELALGGVGLPLARLGGLLLELPLALGELGGAAQELLRARDLLVERLDRTAFEQDVEERLEIGDDLALLAHRLGDRPRVEVRAHLRDVGEQPAGVEVLQPLAQEPDLLGAPLLLVAVEQALHQPAQPFGLAQDLVLVALEASRVLRRKAHGRRAAQGAEEEPDHHASHRRSPPMIERVRSTTSRW